MITIEEINSIESRMSREDAQSILPHVQWKASYWRQGRFAKESITYDKDIFHKKGSKYFSFYTGYLTRIMEVCKNNQIQYDFKSNHIELPHFPPNLPAYYNSEQDYFKEFNPLQLGLIRKCRRYERGIIQSPTGTGKTLLQLGLISCYPNCRTLLLADKIGIIEQTYEKARKFNMDCQMLGGGVSFNGFNSQLVISTIQSFVNLDPEDYMDAFEIVIVDEAHHVVFYSKKIKGRKVNKGQSGTILTNLLAPIKIGFTATIPKEKNKAMTMEGLLGPLIGEMTIDEGKNIGLLAEPFIHLEKIPYNDNIKKLRTYADVYEYGIVDNNARNDIITNICREQVENKKTCLILVTKIRHGQILLDRLSPHMNVEFVQGETQSKTRENIKHALINKGLDCAIATAVWREGINIPSLDVVINACGGKSEIMTLQLIGRGLRKVEGKEDVLIIDFFDPSHRYLVDHFGNRITLYMENHWRFV